MPHEASVAYTQQMSNVHIKVNPRALPRPPPEPALRAAVGWGKLSQPQG